MTDPAPTPDGVMGTPPKPHRSALIRLPSASVPPYRTVWTTLAGIVGEVLLAVIAGVWHLDAAPVACVSAGITLVCAGQAWKAARQHTAQSPGIAASESTP